MIEAAGVLLKQAGQYVLQHRDDLPYIADRDMYSLWGGRMEPEDLRPEDAATRELFEETGVKVAAEDLLHLVSYSTGSRVPNQVGVSVMIHLFFTEVAEDVEINCSEGQGVIRVGSLAEIPAAKVTEYLKKAVELHEQTR